MTIIESIIRVLNNSLIPLTHENIYESIVSNSYYSFKAKDPVSVVRGEIRKHCLGVDFPSASPKKIFAITNSGKGTKPLYSLWDKKSVFLIEHNKKHSLDRLPEEILHENYLIHRENIKGQLLDAIVSADPSFFEQLVVNLLLKMGYGWSVSHAGVVTGGANDYGIDGVISDDKLGLEKTYIQAKRYTKKKVIPDEIRSFIGAMTQKGARKGVFFTSSGFTQQAKNNAAQAQGMNIALVDGELLCEYLVQNDMGVAKVKTYDIYEIDKNFFDF